MFSTRLLKGAVLGEECHSDGGVVAAARRSEEDILGEEGVVDMLILRVK